MGYTLTADAFEAAAKGLAEAVNGGDWSKDYTEQQRDVWRKRLKNGLIAEGLVGQHPADLVRLELWVPVDRADDVRQAVDEIITPVGVSDETLAAIMRTSNKAMAAQSKAMAAWLEDQLPKDTTPP